MTFPPAPRPIPRWLKHPAWIAVAAGFALFGAVAAAAGLALGMPETVLSGALLVVLGGVMEWQRRRSPVRA